MYSVLLYRYINLMSDVSPPLWSRAMLGHARTRPFQTLRASSPLDLGGARLPSFLPYAAGSYSAAYSAAYPTAYSAAHFAAYPVAYSAAYSATHSAAYSAAYSAVGSCETAGTGRRPGVAGAGFGAPANSHLRLQMGHLPRGGVIGCIEGRCCRQRDS